MAFLTRFFLIFCVPLMFCGWPTQSFAANSDCADDFWVTPIRLDPSGLTTIPGSNTMLVVNDQGYVEYEKNKPMIQVLKRCNLMNFNAVIRHENTPQLTGGAAKGKKWDGEDIACVAYDDGRIGCGLLSGKRDIFLWIIAESTSDAERGLFSLSRAFNFNKDIKAESPHAKDNPYELESLQFVGLEGDKALFITLSRGPADRFDGTGNYFVYRLALDLSYTPSSLLEKDGKGYEFVKVGELPNSVCPFDPEEKRSFVNFMRISALLKTSVGTDGFAVCAHEENEDFSYLVPIAIDRNGIEIRQGFTPIPVGFSDIVGFKPKVMKIEGVACQDGHPYVAIDADHRDAGVFPLTKRFNVLCE